DVGERAETRRHAVDGFARGELAFHDVPGRGHPIASLRRQRDRLAPRRGLDVRGREAPPDLDRHGPHATTPRGASAPGSGRQGADRESTVPSGSLMGAMQADIDFQRIATERLTIRRSRAEDAATISAYRSDPDVNRYQGWDRTDVASISAEIAA